MTIPILTDAQLWDIAYAEGKAFAERETARRCAEICHNNAESLAAEMDIKAAFPEAFK